MGGVHVVLPQESPAGSFEFVDQGEAVCAFSQIPGYPGSLVCPVGNHAVTLPENIFSLPVSIFLTKEALQYRPLYAFTTFLWLREMGKLEVQLCNTLQL